MGRSEDYMEEVYKEEERKRKMNNKEQLNLQTYLDELGMRDMYCPSCDCYIGDNMEKWVRGAHKDSYVCRRCYLRFDDLRKSLQSRQGLDIGSFNEKDQPKYICLGCNKEYPPIAGRKLTMKKWLKDPEDDWICISCKIAKHRRISEELHHTSQIVLPYTYLVNGWYLRIARMRLQEFLANEKELEDRIKITVKTLAKEISTFDLKMTADIWYQLENGHTKTIKRRMWERIRYVFYTHGHDIEEIMKDYEAAGDGEDASMKKSPACKSDDHDSHSL